MEQQTDIFSKINSTVNNISNMFKNLNVSPNISANVNIPFYIYIILFGLLGFGVWGIFKKRR